MQRTDLVVAAENIKSAIEESKILPGMELVLRTPEGSSEKFEGLVDALHKFQVLARRFGPAEYRVLKILGLEMLLDSTIWKVLVTKLGSSGRPPGEPIYPIRMKLIVAKDMLPRLLDLITPEYRMLKPSVLSRSLGGDTEVLTIKILENEAELSRVTRIVQALDGVIQLYEACARLEGTAPDALIVAACDSGSDKSFDLVGLAKATTAVKEIILGLWDRVVFYKAKKFELQAQVVGQSLPVMEKLATMKENGHLSPEEAEIIRRGLLQGMTNVLDAGVVIPEVEANTAVSVRVLMAPQPKYLVAASDGPEPPVTGEDGSPQGGAPKKKRRRIVLQPKEDLPRD